jgi:hypothetical protein
MSLFSIHEGKTLHGIYPFMKAKLLGKDQRVTDFEI